MHNLYTIEVALLIVYAYWLSMTTATIPEIEPTREVAGTTWKWKRSLADYPASTWTLTYYFLLETGTTNFSIVATADGDDHLVSVDEAVTANYTKGSYQWQSFAEDGTDRCFVDAGSIIVLQDYSADTADPRTHVQKVFDSLKSAVEGYATSTALKTKINGKEIEKMSYSELMAAYNHFKGLVYKESIENANPDTPNALSEARMIRHVFARPQ